MIKNLGTLAIVLASYILKLMVVFLVIYPASYRCESLKKIYKKSKKQLFFTDFLSFIFEGYFSFVFCSILNIAAPEGDPDKSVVNQIVSYILLIVCLLLLPASLIYIIF